MNTIAVNELKNNLTKIIKKIENGTTVNITSDGKVVARLVPPPYVREAAKKKLREIGKNARVGDLLAPVDNKWEVLEDDNP